MRALGGALGFVLLLLVVRVVFLAAALDPEEERIAAWLDAGELSWPRGPERPLYDREELYTGSAALAMRQAGPLPASVFRFMPYGGGSLLVARIADVLFRLFGTTYQAFKILPLIVTLSAGLCWFLLARAWVGSPAAWAFGLLFAFAPPVLTRTLLIAKGDHAEAALLIGAVLLFASQAVAASTARRRFAWSAAAGLMSGLGVAVTYSTVPVLAGTGIAALVLTRARPARAWAAFAAGLAIGLIPWAATLLGTDGGGLRVYGRPVGTFVPAAEMVRRLLLLGRTGFFAAYDFPWPAMRTAAGLLWLAAVLGSWWGLGQMIRRRPLVLLLFAGTAAHLAAYVLGAPDASSRYLMPVYPLLLLAVAILFAGAPSPARRPAGSDARDASPSSAHGRRALLPGWPVLLLVALGLAAQVVVVSGSSFTALRVPLRGTDSALLGEVLGSKLTSEGIAALPPDARRFAWVGLGRRLSRTGEPGTWPQTVAALGEAARPARDAVWEGIGIGLVETARVATAAELLPRLEARDRAALRRGLSLYSEVFAVPLLLPGSVVDLASLARRFEAEDRPFLVAGLARGAAVLQSEGITLPRERLASLETLIGTASSAGREVFEDALGWASARPGARGTLGFRPLAQAAGVAGERLHPPSRGPAFWEGAAAAWRFHLEACPASWLVRLDGGHASISEGLARELTRLGSSLPAAGSEALAEAAGGAAASAVRSLRLGGAPDVSAGPGPGESALRVDGLPGPMQEACARGFSAGNAPGEWR